jgi:hypothetical protein
MATSDGQPPPTSVVGDSCDNDPNFASICSFLDQFGELCDIVSPSIADLACMLEDCENGMSVTACIHSFSQS